MRMDMKENLTANLIRYRKASGLTQAELAEKLNYSDKSVSKWERGESVPDLFVLKQLADFYGVKIDDLISVPKNEKPKLSKIISKKRLITCSCAVGLVWLIATCCFVFLGIIIPSLEDTWLSFLIATPVTFIVLLIFTGVWGKNLTTAILLSLFIWTFTLAVFMCLNTLLVVPPANLWLIFLIGIPLQALVVFWFLYKKIDKSAIKID